MGVITKHNTCNYYSDHNWCRIRKNNPRVSDHGKIYLCLNSHLSGWITHRIPILIRIQCSMAVNLLIMLYENYVSYLNMHALIQCLYLSRSTIFFLFNKNFSPRFEIITHHNDLVCLWLWCFIIPIVEYFVVVE